MKVMYLYLLAYQKTMMMRMIMMTIAVLMIESVSRKQKSARENGESTQI